MFSFAILRKISTDYLARLFLKVTETISNINLTFFKLGRFKVPTRKFRNA